MASSLQLYPPSPKADLAKAFVGRSIRQVPTPAAVINVAAIRRNCQRMLQTCDTLGLGWRAHVKTHKTVEITHYQVGQAADRPVNLIVSTLAEAEFLLPALQQYRSQGRDVNVLYGLPISSNVVPRLAAVAKALGEGCVSVLLDDPAQMAVVAQLYDSFGVVPRALIKMDMGGRRAGVRVCSDRFVALADEALDAHGQGSLVLSGLYSHAGHSYGGNGRAAAIDMMRAEVTACMDAADRLRSRAVLQSVQNLPPLVLSVGASPTALAVQNLTTAAGERQSPAEDVTDQVRSLLDLFAAAARKGHVVEIHAGVYPTLDLQQLAAHSLDASRLSWGDVALTVLAQVHSVYPGRGANGTDEALIGAGGLALARESCKAYEGMAMLTPWNRPGAQPPSCNVEDFGGWIVGRVSQEHGILTWRAPQGAAATSEAQPQQPPPEVGQKVRLWPNHACITSSHYGWYFVVDEDQPGREDEIVDIWVRARGW